MFPKQLDGATVLYYASEDKYGYIRLSTGEITEEIRYLAICKYKNDADFYLFGCNRHFEVVSDSLWESAEKCMQVAASSYNVEIIWHDLYPHTGS